VPHCRIAPIVYLIAVLPGTQKGYVVRPTVVILIATLMMPVALTARPLASGLTASPAVTDISAAKKKKKPAKVKEEYLKAAPGTGPSGPTK
jgi:hypothetical protein